MSAVTVALIMSFRQNRSIESVQRYIRQHGYTSAAHADHLATKVKPNESASPTINTNKGWLLYKDVKKHAAKIETAKRKREQRKPPPQQGEESEVLDHHGRLVPSFVLSFLNSFPTDNKQPVDRAHPRAGSAGAAGPGRGPTSDRAAARMHIQTNAYMLYAYMSCFQK